MGRVPLVGEACGRCHILGGASCTTGSSSPWREANLLANVHENMGIKVSVFEKLGVKTL